MSLFGACLVSVPLGLSLRAYVDLVEWTGHQVRPGKRGTLAKDTVGLLHCIGDRPDRWVSRVQGIGSGYWRVVGQLADLRAAAARLPSVRKKLISG